MINEHIESWKKQIIESANIAVREVCGIKYEFELQDIKFTLDYDDKTNEDEIALVDITGQYGIPGEHDS